MVVSTRREYAAFRQSNDSEDFARWGRAQRLTFATEPLVRGTRSLGGGLIPMRNVYMFHPKNGS
ncbi:hypothetical protein [Streptomyces sp. NPDC005281]|uniref:hypothetical protein n=1 Tax=Streptomyces sp. NPDC005281 TaxID=3155712 RepID=UPI0033B8FCAC